MRHICPSWAVSKPPVDGFVEEYQGVMQVMIKDLLKWQLIPMENLLIRYWLTSLASVGSEARTSQVASLQALQRPAKGTGELSQYTCQFSSATTSQVWHIRALAGMRHPVRKRCLTALRLWGSVDTLVRVIEERERRMVIALCEAAGTRHKVGLPLPCQEPRTGRGHTGVGWCVGIGINSGIPGDQSGAKTRIHHACLSDSNSVRLLQQE